MSAAPARVVCIAVFVLGDTLTVPVMLSDGNHAHFPAPTKQNILASPARLHFSQLS